MNTQKLTFENREGLSLAGRLELPLDQRPHNFVLFAHCFTCTKNLNAVVHISRELTRAGFGVLRFDFTGLGESEGEFADTNFSGNVDDLVSAAEFLAKHYSAPTLLIGHSLGGAAAILAAARLPQVRAVATIGTPADPEHVTRLLKDSEAELNRHGKATVQLSGRDFTIKKQFVEDLKRHELTSVVHVLEKALLVLHSPQDTTVTIDNAEKLFVAARHPRSFISLDGADHLLTREADALYVGKTIAAWASRYVTIPEVIQIAGSTGAVASLNAADGFTTTMRLGSHTLIADEPISFGGNDFGPSPYDYLSGALAACTAMTIQIYARRKAWDVANVTVQVMHAREHALDCAACEEASAKIDTFHKEITLTGNLNDDQKKRLLQIADKCPVHKTLHSAIEIRTKPGA